MTTTDAAERSGLPRKVIVDLCDSGALQAFRHGGRRYVNPDDVRQLIEIMARPVAEQEAWKARQRARVVSDDPAAAGDDA